MHYDKVADFISLATEVVPELLNISEKAQLVMSLRARLVLELCRGDAVNNLLSIQKQLDQIHVCGAQLTSTQHLAIDDALKTAYTSFASLVQKLLNAPLEKEIFFQEVFPTLYGCEHELSLQRLVLRFLSNLERLLPIPDLQQTAAWLSSAAWLPEELGQHLGEPSALKTLLLHHRQMEHLTAGWSSAFTPHFQGLLALSHFLLCSSAASSSDDAELGSVLTLPGVTYAHINIYTECRSDAGEDKEAIVVEHSEEDSSVRATEAKTLGKCRETKKKRVLGRRKGKGEESATQNNPENKKGRQKRAQSGVDRRFLVTRAVDTHFTEKDTKCSKCEKVFDLPNQLTTHLRLHSFPYSCSQCEKGFLSLSGFQQHRRLHTRGRRFICSQCNKGFLCSYSLRQHQQLHRGPSNTCTTCGKAFSKSGFLRHVQMHRGEKNHLCTVCGKSFLSSGELLLHTRSHTGEVPHTCTHCGKGFSTKGHLIVHVRSHTGERPYRCSLCPKRFLTLGCVKRHMLSHNGEKPFKCPSCHKEFSQQGNMKRHLATHSNQPQP
uniref:C2H2-type domain-containing protein n=1 Tax=Tetraodon nigroviridis TaxID=99883 RepID=H3C5V8_TETNG